MVSGQQKSKVSQNGGHGPSFFCRQRCPSAPPPREVFCAVLFDQHNINAVSLRALQWSLRRYTVLCAVLTLLFELRVSCDVSCWGNRVEWSAPRCPLPSRDEREGSSVFWNDA